MPHRNIRRTLAIILVLAIFMAACQSAALPTPGDPTAQPTRRPVDTAVPLPTATLAPTATPSFPADVTRLDGLHITIWHPWMDQLASALQRAADEFNRSNTWGIVVGLKGFGGSSSLEDAFLAADGKDLPALVVAPPESLATWQTKTGQIFDISLLTEDPEWGLTQEEKNDFIPGLWPPPPFDKGYISIPALENARFMIYNRTWAEELGFSAAPKTPEEFATQVCGAMKANLKADYTLRGSGGWLLDNDAATISGWLEGFDSLYTLANPAAPYAFNTPQGLQTFIYLQKLVADKCIVSVNSASPQPYAVFAERRALVYAASLGDLPMQAQVSKKLESTDQWAVMPFPALDGTGIVPISGVDFGLVKTTGEEELAGWLFIRWLLLPRNQASLAQAGDLLPATLSGIDELKKSSALSPQHEEVLNLSGEFRPLPRFESWATVRWMIEDAAWQLYQPYTKPENIPTILQQLDAMIVQFRNK